MNCLIVVTRNEAASVKTLHSILMLNFRCIEKNVRIEINFVKDDPFEKSKMIMKKAKTSDRIIFIDYGLGLDVETMERCLNPLEKWGHGIVFPTVTEDIDWEMFNNKARSNCVEPPSQMGLNFDTAVGEIISGEDNYKVIKTIPKCWAIDTKFILRTMKGPKGTGLSLPAQNQELFQKFISKGLKLYAFCGANITTTFQHECLGNILNMPGLTKEKPL